MADKNKPFRKPVENPGEIYKAISIDTRDFGVSEKLTRKKEDWFVRFCKKIYEKFPNLGGSNAKYSDNYAKAINFLDWDLRPEEYNAAVKFSLFLCVLIVGILVTLGFLFLLKPLSKMFGTTIFAMVMVFGIPLIIGIYSFVVIKNYPLSKVADEKVKALTFVPETLGYMIMSMKLVPNLEKAIEFAADHGHGKIADDLKKLLWEVKVGIKNSVAEALDDLAYRWGDVSSELKKGLMKIRASVIETSESKRFQLLDQTMSDTLASIKNTLEDYARSLNQPAMIMFYLGVLLPLLLIIVLPVGSAFSGSALAKPIYLILIYNIGLPIGCLLFARYVIKNRPKTYDPPNIPDNHPKLPPKNSARIGKLNINIFIILVIILVSGVFASIYLQTNFGKTRESVLEYNDYDVVNPGFHCDADELRTLENNPEYMCRSEVEFWQQPENDITPYYIIYGILLTFSAILSLWLYFTSIYKRKIQLESERMEGEFKDALYVIASRLGENKPIEDALEHTRKFLPKSLIAKDVFGKAIDNIRIMGLTLQSSLFDKNYGALKNNPSRIINSAMQLMVDSVQLGVSVAAKTLMSYSLQLRNTDEVNKMLSNLVSDTVNTLSSMSKFIAPIVLGITTALQKIVISTLTSISNSGTLSDISQMAESIKTGVSGAGMGSINTGNLTSFGDISPEIISQIASPTVFMIIVAIYVIQIVIIMTYFTTKIEQDNNTLVKLRIAKTLPIAVVLFIITTILANLIF